MNLLIHIGDMYLHTVWNASVKLFQDNHIPHNYIHKIKWGLFAYFNDIWLCNTIKIWQNSHNLFN